MIVEYTPAGTFSLLAHPPWLVVDQVLPPPEVVGRGVGAAA
jgi:hypothetical protein